MATARQELGVFGGSGAWSGTAAVLAANGFIRSCGCRLRMLFNDYWNGTYEKPAAFTERLDQAEDYLNERLATSGEIWQLDAKTRVMLGLPPTKSGANPPRP